VTRRFPAAACAAMLCWAAPAVGGEVFAPPDGLWVGPAVYDGTLYGPTSHDATWHVTQWQSPGPALPGFEDGRTDTPSQHVVWSDSGRRMVLDGSALACDAEFGGFFEPNIEETYPGFPAAGGDSMPLSAMSSLRHRISVTYLNYQVFDAACNNQGTFLTALVLRNKVDGSTLFYQVSMVFQGMGEGDPWPEGYWWKATPTEMGFSDSIYHYGFEPPALGERASYDLELLPRVKEVIAMSVAADRDLAHWVVNSTYHGAHVWGHVKSASVWDGYSLAQR